MVEEVNKQFPFLDSLIIKYNNKIRDRQLKPLYMTKYVVN